MKSILPRYSHRVYPWLIELFDQVCEDNFESSRKEQIIEDVLEVFHSSAPGRDALLLISQNQAIPIDIRAQVFSFVTKHKDSRF